MDEFFKTLMGKRFFEGQVPQVVTALKDIAKELKRANDLKEKEMQHMENESN